MIVSHLVRALGLFLDRRRFGRRFVGLGHEAPFGELRASEDVEGVDWEQVGRDMALALFKAMHGKPAYLVEEKIFNESFSWPPDLIKAFATPTFKDDMAALAAMEKATYSSNYRGPKGVDGSDGEVRA